MLEEAGWQGAIVLLIRYKGRPLIPCWAEDKRGAAMKRIVFATGNKERLRRVREAVAKYGSPGVDIAHRFLDFPEPRKYDPCKIAVDKALFAYPHITSACIVADSGFFVPALRGFPRTYIHFMLDTIGVEGLLTLLRGKPRGCEFRHCLAYYDGGSTVLCFRSVSKGAVGNRTVGKPGAWPLHRVFIPGGHSKAIAAMSASERDIWTAQRERGYFITRFANWLSGKGRPLRVKVCPTRSSNRCGRPRG